MRYYVNLTIRNRIISDYQRKSILYSSDNSYNSLVFRYLICYTIKLKPGCFLFTIVTSEKSDYCSYL